MDGFETETADMLDEDDSGKFKGPVAGVLFSTLLVFCVLGGAMIGPSSQKLETKDSWVKTQYSYLVRIFYCIPLAVLEACLSGRDKHNKSYWERVKLSLTRKNWILGFLAPAFLVPMNFSLVFAADNLIQSHAYICNTLFSVWVVLIGFCLFRQMPLWIEIVGLLLTVAAITCMFADPSAVRTDGKEGEAWVYAVTIGCSVFGALLTLA